LGKRKRKAGVIERAHRTAGNRHEEGDFLTAVQRIAWGSMVAAYDGDGILQTGCQRRVATVQCMYQVVNRCIAADFHLQARATSDLGQCSTQANRYMHLLPL